MHPTSYHVIGTMSGTSLDGLDMAHCRFEKVEGEWQFQILHAQTMAYPESWQSKLTAIMETTAFELALADVALGNWMGEQVTGFIQEHQLKADFVASHGHTVFHRPEKRLTVQIGKGAAMAAAVGLPVINDFRSSDVALGGQGAPLVPIGDRLLFPEWEVCLNLGGIANFSAASEGQRIAFDVCAANQVLNVLANRQGKPYDENGNLAKSGSLLPEVLVQLNALPFYARPYPKSLGKEWVDAEVLPLLSTDQPAEDLLHTFCHHVALQLGRSIAAIAGKAPSILVTGGGAFNAFLMECCKHYLPRATWSVPNEALVSFKEALIFAFLAVLRWRNEPNALASVTGAAKDSCGGSIWLP